MYSLVLMKGASPATQWQSKQICPLMGSQLLELLFCQNLNVLKCLILWVLVSTISKDILDVIWSICLYLYQCVSLCLKLLEHITFVDTPGVLSGEKQRTQRAYDFTGVTSWFAAKCDLILLLFDPHKLDISDEFKRVISSLRGHDDKIRVVLNKADQVDTQQVRTRSTFCFWFSDFKTALSLASICVWIFLSYCWWSILIPFFVLSLQLMRVYGALMWSLGKVLNTPEVMRVYIG